VGTPASSSRIGLRYARARGEAYSLRKTAAERPSGSATRIAMTLVITVATTRGAMPTRPASGAQTVSLKN
jgi:hypothetical protein